MRMSSVQVLIALVVSALAACAILSPDRARVSVNFQIQRSNVGLATLKARLITPDWSRSITQFDFTRSDAPNYTPEYDTPTHGPLRLDVELVTPAGQPISSGSAELELRPDWTWSIGIFADTVNPTKYCFGCAGYRAFPIDAAYRRSSADSMYIVWGGNYIKHPVIY